MKKYILLFFIIISFFIGCSESSAPTETNFDSSINERSIAIKTGQQCTIKLDVNADAGYQWTYTISSTAVMNIDSTRYMPKSGNLNEVGGVTVETFYFSGKGTGQCLVNLIEHRIWEKGISPINTIQFSVIVK